MLQLKVNHIYPPIPSRQYDWAVTEKDYDQGQVVGYGLTIQQALKDFLYAYESKHDVDIENIKYKWS